VEVMDIDGDNYNDVVSLSEDGKRVRIHIYDSKKYTFTSHNVYSLDNKFCKINNIKVLTGSTVMLVFFCGESEEKQYLTYADLPTLKLKQSTPDSETKIDASEFQKSM
jgi:ribosomal protein S4E